ncbi:MAG: SRPBCC domain-containing protein [Pseudomonadales bacterium]|nr:SRPBCC domain-containing protein [Pseudomonadales bacterium]
MLEIQYQRKIKSSANDVWQVLLDTDAYEQWNPFVHRCQSSFAVGAPIIMHVALIPGILLRQKETILSNQAESLLEYGIKIPFLLSSSRKHILKNTEAGQCEYESLFVLKGPLSPLVNLLLGGRLRLAFLNMTDALVIQSEKKA